MVSCILLFKETKINIRSELKRFNTLKILYVDKFLNFRPRRLIHSWTENDYVAKLRIQSVNFFKFLKSRNRVLFIYSTQKARVYICSYDPFIKTTKQYLRSCRCLGEIRFRIFYDYFLMSVRLRREHIITIEVMNRITLNFACYDNFFKSCASSKIG